MENDLDLVRRGQLVESMFGWEIVQDTATSQSPLVLTPSTWIDLPNNGLGSRTTSEHLIPGRPSIWDTAQDCFINTSLKIGDTVDVRFDVNVTTSSANTEVSSRLIIGEGDPGEFTIGFGRRLFKSAGTYQLRNLQMFIVDDDYFREQPAKVQIYSDTAGVTTVVDKWSIRTLARF